MKNTLRLLAILLPVLCVPGLGGAVIPTGYAAAVTGGAAGSTVTVSTAADLRAYAESDTPRTIIIWGVIDLGLNGHINVRSNKTITGRDTTATLLGSLRIEQASNIIISHLNISADTGTPGSNDGITLIGCTNVLVTKCTIFNCADGNLDIVGGSDLVTVSWCRFYYTRDNTHNFSNLIGSSDTDFGAGNGLDNYRITWHHNWWAAGCMARMTACRFGRSHMFSNYFSPNTGVTFPRADGSSFANDYCTEARLISSILSEHNSYDGARDPLGKRTAEPVDVGLLKTFGNIFHNCSGSQLVSHDDIFTPPYSYQLTAATAVPAAVMAGAGNVAADAPAWGSAALTTSATSGNATLTVIPTGFTPISYQWRLRNHDLAGATGATYQVADVQPDNAGPYAVVLGLPAGGYIVSSALTIGEAAAPTITGQPAGVTVTSGTTTTFTVVAIGNAPLSYQWRRDGADLPGATSMTYSIPSTTAVHAGNYTVAVTNPAGTTISSTATLTVNTPVVPPPAPARSGGGGGGAPSLGFLLALSLLAVLRRRLT